MNPNNKLGKSHKSNSVYVIVAGLFIITSLAVTLYLGSKISSFYTDLLDKSHQAKYSINSAIIELKKNQNSQSDENLKRAWEEFNLADFYIDEVFKKSESLALILFSFDFSLLQSEIQKLQVQLLEYRGIIKSAQGAPQDSMVQKDAQKVYDAIVYQTGYIEQEIKKMIDSSSRFFKYAQIISLGTSIVLITIFAIMFFYYEKQRTTYFNKLETATTSIEKGLRKTTRTEEALQESQRKLNTLINNLPGMVYRFNGENIWSMDFVSDNSVVITGYKPEELIHDKVISYYNIINNEDKKRIFDQVQKAIEERKPYQLVYRINTSSGYEKWVWEQGVGVFSEVSDELLALEGFITDITEQKAVEDQLNLQSNALEAAANGIVIMDNNGLVIWCNTAFTLLTGYMLKEIVGKNLEILKSPTFPPEVYELMWTTVTNGNVWHGELINRRKDGTNYFEDTTITPVKNTNGEIKYFISIKQDISDRKQAEDYLRESELRFRGVYENATIGLYRTTLEGLILMANPTLLKIVGIGSLNEFVKIKAKDVYFDPNDREMFLRELNMKEKVFGFETRYKRVDGSLIYIRESARLVRNDNDKIAYIEGTIEDITEKKLVELALIEAKERAEKSDKLKSEFLAQISHEIRTPLNVILNFSGILKEELEDKLDDDLKDSFNVIDTEGKRITRTVELILNMSELQTGNYSFKSNKFDLFEKTLSNLYKSFKYVAEQKNIELNMDNRIGEAIINADEYSVNQIFNHLIDNGIKYTSKGKVDIIVNRDINNRIFVDVADTGIGIDEEYMQMMFTPFTKEEVGYTRNFEGNGLGLALVKKYCELNHAEIKVVSQKGKGSTFRVTFLSIN